jgi:hypothetical protein
MALETAASGGTSRLSSSGRVYNELAATRPDLVKVLSEEWPLDRFGLRICLDFLSNSRFSLALEATRATPSVHSYITTKRMGTSSSNTLVVISRDMVHRNEVAISHPSQRRRQKRLMLSISLPKSILLDSISKRAISSTSIVLGYFMLETPSQIVPRNRECTSMERRCTQLI